MKMHIILSGVAAAALAISGAASAANPGKGNGHGKGSSSAAHERNAQRGNSGKSYVMQDYTSSKKTARTAANCPPGLAKKNNGCRAPGQVKDRNGSTSRQLADLIKLPTL
jgi:hypothetical protein